MARDKQAQFREKEQLVALFRAQMDLLCAADSKIGEGIRRHVNVGYYDELLREGAEARWPKGILSGLKEGIRDAQIMLDMAYPGSGRVEVLRKLRAASGDAVMVLEARDSRRLATVRRRARVRTEEEYYLVVAAIDRLEAQGAPDQELLDELRHLADSAHTS